jgi:hypothetical protein
MGAAETEDERGEDWRHKAAVHEQVRCAIDQSVEKDADNDEAQRREDETLTRAEGEGVLQFAQRDTGKEGADIRKGGVFEEADDLGGAVAVDGTNDVVGIEVEIERVRNQADDP